jgi:hypothetical protein
MVTIRGNLGGALWGNIVLIGSRTATLLVAGFASLMVLHISRADAQWWNRAPADFEDCAAAAEKSATKEEKVAALSQCNSKYAGRRKPGGGYSYYDFMQDRKFDIAGPNPTGEERKAIDRAYIGYLEGQRREAITEALAKQQNDKLRADIESALQPAGAPLSLTPTNVPLPVPRRVAEQRARVQRCAAEESLSCTISKLSSAVKDAFASSSRTRN